MHIPLTHVCIWLYMHVNVHRYTAVLAILIFPHAWPPHTTSYLPMWLTVFAYINSHVSS